MTRAPLLSPRALPPNCPPPDTHSMPQVYQGSQMAGAKLKPVDELQDVFEAAGVDVQGPVVCR